MDGGDVAEADHRAGVAAEGVEVDAVEDAHGAVAATGEEDGVVVRVQVMVELCETLVIAAGEVFAVAVIDIGGDGDAIAALLDGVGGLFDARAVGGAGGGADSDVAAGFEGPGGDQRSHE